MQKLSSGLIVTLRKYLPEPVTRKYSPASFGTEAPMGFHSPGTSSSFTDSTSSGLTR